MILMSITTYLGLDIQSTHVLDVTPNNIDTKDPREILGFVDYFLCTESPDSYKINSFSPFGKWMRLEYLDKLDNELEILVTWSIIDA